MKLALSVKIRVEGERCLIERARNVLIPDFVSTISNENVEVRGEKAVWNIDLSAETVSRLRAITNSILRAISLFLEIEGIFEETGR